MKRIKRLARLALFAATVAGLTGCCCWTKSSDCSTKKPCAAPDCRTHRNVDVNVGAHAGSSGIGMDAGIDRK